jgi:hypothetical protein
MMSSDPDRGQDKFVAVVLFAVHNSAAAVDTWPSYKSGTPRFNLLLCGMFIELYEIPQSDREFDLFGAEWI